MNRTATILVSVGALALITSSVRQEPTAPPKRKRKRRRKRRKRHAGRGYITHSTLDRYKTVRESPAELLAQARKHIPDITLDEMTAARLIVSEHSSGTVEEWAAIVDAELNRAESKKRTLTAHLTSAGTYGKQGSKIKGGKNRPASTRFDFKRKHLRIARAVISGELRGASHGAVRFFDPVSQMSSHLKWLRGDTEHRHCHPAVIIERWTHASKWRKGGPPCTLRQKIGRSPQEWVGPLDGIDPLRVMLLRPAKPGAEHKRRYREARRLILKRFPLPSKGANLATL